MAVVMMSTPSRVRLWGSKVAGGFMTQGVGACGGELGPLAPAACRILYLDHWGIIASQTALGYGELWGCSLKLHASVRIRAARSTSLGTYQLSNEDGGRVCNREPCRHGMRRALRIDLPCSSMTSNIKQDGKYPRPNYEWDAPS